MGSRLDFHEILKKIIGNTNVYFEPPPSMLMKYPCIVYEREVIKTKFSDDIPYRLEWRYQVTVIDRSPETVIPDKIAHLPKTTQTRSYVSDNLHHYVFTIYF